MTACNYVTKQFNNQWDYIETWRNKFDTQKLQQMSGAATEYHTDDTDHSRPQTARKSQRDTEPSVIESTSQYN